MLRKRFYIPIGFLILAICVVGFLSLRSDVPDEQITIFKVTTPQPETTTRISDTYPKETSTSGKATGGHFHDDGTWHAGKVPTLPDASRNPRHATEDQPVKTENHTAGSVPLLEDLPLEDPVLADLDAKRLQLEQREKQEMVMLDDFLAAARAKKLSRSEFLKTAEDLYRRSENPRNTGNNH